MSQDQNAAPKANRRYVGKVRNQTTQYGNMQKIYMDNLSSQNADGSPNTFFKGALVWHDIDGKQYQVKQLSFWVPREGMKPELTQKGFTCFVTLNLDDKYEVDLLT